MNCRACVSVLALAVLMLLQPIAPCSAEQKKSATTAKPASAEPAKTPEKAPEVESLLENPWQTGMLLRDTNGDKLPDAVCGHVIVGSSPTSAENAAAANLAARIGYETTALTLPIVAQQQAPAASGCPAEAVNVWVGESALSAEQKAAVRPVLAGLSFGEGAVVVVKGGIAVVGPDPVGLMTAANAYAARAPYIWMVPGDKLSSIARKANVELTKADPKQKAVLEAILYAANGAGVRRVVLHVEGGDTAAWRKALRPEDGTPVQLGAVREVVLNAADAELTLTGAPVKGGPLPTAPEAGEGGGGLDLARLYTVKGLLTGSPKKPIPSGTAAKLYVHEGKDGVATANLAARIGLETVGISLPIAFADTGIATSQLQGIPVVAEGTPATDHLEDLLAAKPNSDLDKLAAGTAKKADTDKTQLEALSGSEGELRVVEHGAGKADALLVRGDSDGAAAVTEYAATRLPYLWETGKRYASIEEVRDDLRHFFGLKSDVGQAAAALYHLDQWSAKLAKEHPGTLSSVRAEIDVDQADPQLKEFARKMLAERLHADSIEVTTGSLHAGIKCCDGEVPQHLQSDVFPFHQAKPTIVEDLTFPWEGTRMLETVRKLAASVPAGQLVVVQAGVSESPEERALLTKELRTALEQAGVRAESVEVLSAYKQGYSWLMDSVAPELAGKKAEKIEIEFAPYRDPKKESAMRSEDRWIQQLYPVDEMLAKKLGIALDKIQLKKMDSDAGPTYRVHAFSSGKEILTREFTAHIHERPYSGEFHQYEKVGIETGWVTLWDKDGKVLCTERVPTDTEMFWEHYQDATLPKILHYVLAENNGKPKIEYQPLFDTIKVDFHMSEPDYSLGLDQERISSLEGLQEDLLFATQNSFYIFGNTYSTGMMDYMGRVLPIAHVSDEGKAPHIKVEFYATDAGHPQVKLAWKAKSTDDEQEWTRDMPAIAAGDPRLVAVRVRAGEDAVQKLTWSLPVASKEDKFDEWRNLVSEISLEHTVLSAEQAQAQLVWLKKMHDAGLYGARLAYPHLKQLGFEFTLPLELHPAEHTRPEVVTAATEVPAPLHPRPQISDIAPAAQNADKTYVQWEHPIGIEENEKLLSRLSTFPGVTVYWMGRSYLGNDIWAADLMLPTPSELRSMAKETTLKAAIIYSGRQHANEVSSTSHIHKLAEQLMLDPNWRKTLDKVNVVVHPITNPDGVELAMDMAKITPDNMLHAGYHASLTADMVTGQWDKDPVYPESRTRRQLWETWLPDGFLNPHGYPSHEWVQPYSEYAAWVITRNGAEMGRAWWIPRGWFTSLYYFDDPEHPQSKTVNYTLRDYIVDSMAKAPSVLDMNARMNGRYFRYGQQWDQVAFQQPIYKGVRVYMAVKGQTPGARMGAFSARFPDVTYDDGYTEAPDETARGPWLHLVAGAGLAYDEAHLNYLNDSKFKIKRTQKEFFDGVQWSVNRERPMVPALKPAADGAAATPASTQQH